MNIAELSVKKKTITLTLVVVATVGGLLAYRQLPRLEDPEFTIKDAKIETRYPGASPKEVEEEVTNEIEKACQELGQLKRVKSKSLRGLSIVTPTIKDKYNKDSLPQVWDELRQKINDRQRTLPPGTQATLVNNDFGDVYGTFYALTGDGYSYADLKEFAKYLQRELLLQKDVKKVTLSGVVDEAIYIEMNSDKMANMGISPDDIYAILKEKNLVADAGHVKIGPDYITISPSGGIEKFDQLGDILIKKTSKAGRLVYLKDVAKIKRGYVDPPQTLMRYNGKEAVGVAISTVQGGNVVEMGEAVEKRIGELMANAPAGMKLGAVNLQARSVVKSINSFVINLIEAVGIVIAVLLIFMGIRSGFLIGAILVITIAASFCVMGYYEITLQRISLGALIIALGMLVDNAIVITDGALIRIEEGMERLKAVKEIVSQTMTPLLLATSIAIITFASIGLSEDSTGEYCGTLFYVLLISLGLSWVTAVTVTPLFCVMFLKPSKKKGDGETKDPYDNAFYNAYRKFLAMAIKHRWATCVVMIAMLVAAMFGFTKVDKSFFPDSTRNQYYVSMWMPYGTYIKDTAKKIGWLESFLLKQEHVKSVTSFVGQGAPRFILTYTPEDKDTAYAIALIEVDDPKNIDALYDKTEAFVKNDPNLWEVLKFRLGPGDGGKIQARFSGPDPDVLYGLAEKTKRVMEKTGQLQGVRSDWRDRVKVLTPVFAQQQARRNGIDYQDFAKALREGFEGASIGVFREKDNLISIVARAPSPARNDVESIEKLQIWSPVAQRMIPLRQVMEGVKVTWEYPVMARRNRRPTITIHANPDKGISASLPFDRVKKELDSWKLPPGTFLEWGGDYESSHDAQAGLAASLPIFGVLIVLMLVFLFNNLRQPLIIVLTVPLAAIGVTVGLLVFKQPFGFMALLGAMSLMGMQIKNAIVLIDEINCQSAAGKAIFPAILDSAVSRVRPVAMAAATTVLGMIPLVKDAFFVSMAVTIMFGLTFACILTLVVVPVFYAVFYKVKAEA
jgi:multidrug efflux pump subunit AcrB